MDFDELKYWRKEKSIDKLHKELFESLPENKYYNLGLAVAFSSLYKVFKDYKFKDIAKEEILEFLKISADTNKDVHYYFYNLLDEER